MGLAFSPDDRRILTGDDDNMVRAWRGAPRAPELIRYKGHRGAVSVASRLRPMPGRGRPATTSRGCGDVPGPAAS